MKLQITKIVGIYARACLLGVLALGFSTTASAFVISQSVNVKLNTLYAGTQPIASNTNNNWWLKATLGRVGNTDNYTLALYANLANSQFVGGKTTSGGNAYPIGWAFNLVGVGSTLGVSCTSGSACADSYKFSNIGTGPVPGNYNLAFFWKKTSGFAGIDNATYTLTTTNTLSGLQFSSGNYASVAHIQNISSGCSGWIVNGSGSVTNPNQTPVVGGSQTCQYNVPEPAEWTIMLPGLGGMALFAWIEARRRRSKRSDYD